LRAKVRRKGEEESSGAGWEETSFYSLQSCTFANTSVFFFLFFLFLKEVETSVWGEQISFGSE